MSHRLSHVSDAPRRGAGFSMIGILLVLVILFVLSGYYFGGSLNRQQQSVGTYQYTTQRARNVAQDANLQTLQTSVNVWVMQHPSERCTIEKLQAGGSSVPGPPAGFKYEIDENNQAVLVEVQPATPGFAPGGAPPSPNP